MVQEARELHKHLPPLGRPVVALFVIHQQFCMLIITGNFVCLDHALQPNYLNILLKAPAWGHKITCKGLQ